MMPSRCSLLAVPLAIAACEPPATPIVAMQPQPSASATTEAPPLEKGVFPSKRFGMMLALPHGAAWKIDDHSSRWLEAKQPEEGSSVLVRLWRGENRMSRDKCEEIARGLRKLPVRENAEIVESRPIDVPPGFDTRADVALVPDQKGGFFGFVLAFGGLGRRCFAFVYATHTSGPRADQEVGDRLAKMVEGSLLSTRFDSDLDVVLERESTGP